MLKGNLALNPVIEDNGTLNKIKISITDRAKETLGIRKMNVNGRKNNKP